MLKVLERNYKQTMESALKEFPNSVVVMSIDNVDDEEGYILAVSTAIESEEQLGNYMDTIPKGKRLYIAGEYLSGGRISVY